MGEICSGLCVRRVEQLAHGRGQAQLGGEVVRHLGRRRDVGEMWGDMGQMKGRYRCSSLASGVTNPSPAAAVPPYLAHIFTVSPYLPSPLRLTSPPGPPRAPLPQRRQPLALLRRHRRGSLGLTHLVRVSVRVGVGFGWGWGNAAPAAPHPGGVGLGGIVTVEHGEALRTPGQG